MDQGAPGAVAGRPPPASAGQALPLCDGSKPRSRPPASVPVVRKQVAATYDDDDTATLQFEEDAALAAALAAEAQPPPLSADRQQKSSGPMKFLFLVALITGNRVLAKRPTRAAAQDPRCRLDEGLGDFRSSWSRTWRSASSAAPHSRARRGTVCPSAARRRRQVPRATADVVTEEEVAQGHEFVPPALDWARGV